MYDVNKIRKDFPILKIKANGKNLVYFDNAATTQKPVQVINGIKYYYENYNSNIHRGMYKIAEMATEKYIESKTKFAKFINAESIEEIVYTKNTTEAINFVALAFGNEIVKRDDHILISEAEHHSNLLPWLWLAKRKKAHLDYIKLNKEKTGLDIESLKMQLEKEPKITAVFHASNVLGSINDIKYITRLAHGKNSKVLIDGAQSIPNMKIDVRDAGCDFFAASAHKMMGPAGIGVLFAKKSILDTINPLFGGGEMVKQVSKHSCTLNDLPWRFESGTQNIEGAIGLASAIDYINKIGIENIRKHEQSLIKYAFDKLGGINNLEIFGGRDEKNKVGIISFAINKVHPHDIAYLFDKEGIAIRAGHHCAMPIVSELSKEHSISRMSFYLYNTAQEIDAAAEAINKIKNKFNIR
ncbi:SufS family cysteine desulfurase [Candidatus Marsarchaeota archaeon]|nr:SufS family cysteine desulfurase [Candidatus Marsarchaeota archaeon]